MDNDEDAVMQYYDADGKKVKQGDVAAVVQYLSNDPARPDAEAKAKKAPAEDKAVSGPAESK